MIAEPAAPIQNHSGNARHHARNSTSDTAGTGRFVDGGVAGRLWRRWGGGGSSAPSYTIGVKVGGLTSGMLTLLDNGGDPLPIPGSSACSYTSPCPASFATPVASGDLFRVTVGTQPSGQNCVVLNGAGVASANQTGSAAIAVQCSAPIAAGAWTWMAGANTSSGAITSYGSTVGTPGGTLGARYGAASWAVAANDTLWLFGGNDATNFYSDLWKFDAASGTWTWYAGSNSPSQPGSYGSVGAPGGAPGARSLAGTWFDGADLWLFGGVGCGSVCSSSANVGPLNDLWKFDPSTGTWTWVSGATTISANGVYSGTTPSPGARFGASTWFANGSLWLFGGAGMDGSGRSGNLNDLWKYDVASGDWTFVTGSQNVSGSAGPSCASAGSSGSVPSARQNASAWVDGQGDLWLFGGAWTGSTSPGSTPGGSTTVVTALYDDLWEYVPGSGTWYCWPATASTPAARYLASSWGDAAGNFWMFGGEGVLGGGGSSSSPGYFGDLWKLIPPTSSAGSPTWFRVSGASGSCGASGGSSQCAAGVYGTMGVTASSSLPGARFSASAWALNGSLWLFGGSGFDSTGALGNLNDLWQFTPPTPEHGPLPGDAEIRR